jgi:4-amino-4-deoxy-L-arabinose transferase-like glycosyltransferase
MINAILFIAAFVAMLNASMNLARLDRRLAYLAFAAFAGVSIAGLINSSAVNFYSYDRDWFFLETRALYFSQMNFGFLEMLQEARGRQLYSVLVSLSFRLFGHHEFPLVLLNAVLFTFTIAATYRIAIHFGANQKFAFLAALFIAIFPPIVTYSIQPSREPLVLFCFATGMLMCLRYTVSQDPRHFLASMALLAVASVVHTVMIVALLGFLVIALRSTLGRNPSKASRNRRVFSLTVMVLIGLPALGIFVASGAGLAKLGGDVGNITAETLEARFVTRDADNRAGYFSPLELQNQSLGSHIGSIPKRVWLFSTKPYPNNIGAAADILALAINIAMILFVLAVLKSRRGWLAAANRKPVLIAVACIYVILAAGTNNWGTAVRHKTKIVLPCVAIYAALLTDQERRRRTSGAMAALQGRGVPAQG